MAVQNTNYFNFSIIKEYPSHSIASISVDSNAIDVIYKEAVIAQKDDANTYGFSKGTVPIHYIENNFRSNIVEHLKEFFFMHGVFGFLAKSLIQNKIVVTGDCLLNKIDLEPGANAKYTFILPQVKVEKEEKWKKLNLRAPERKNYKDLDRQVEYFIKEEIENSEKYTENAIGVGDWVCFNIYPLNRETKKPLLNNYKDQLWIKLSNEEADMEIKNLFIEKKKGDIFQTNSGFFQDYVSNTVNMNYLFEIEIVDYIPKTYFSFDYFKKHFQLKNSKELHQKLIEVFSFRNDISQRRETIEATFKLLLKYYMFSVPRTLLEKKRQLVLKMVHDNPDYHVYKAQNDFKDKIKLLAEKQLKETIIIDTISFQENIVVDHNDIACYLNLIKRPRTKEFIYFDLPPAKSNGLEMPISTEMLKQYCLREKTLNQIIYSLTKRI